MLTGSEEPAPLHGFQLHRLHPHRSRPALLGQPLSQVEIPTGQGILGILRANGSVELNTVPSP
ncbi:MAG: hypothetical protein ACLU9S_04025 [Oscillospiraceae bacterium]